MTWTSKVIPWEQCDARRQGALTAAWKRGRLRYKLDKSQKVVYNDIKAKFSSVNSSFQRRYVLDIGRRWGKDFLMLVLANETAMTTPNNRIVYGAAYQTDVRKFLEPMMKEIISDCPEELRPAYKAQDCRWLYPSGTTLDLVGCDLYPERLRGPKAIAIFLTEMAFMSNIENGIMSALMPQVLTEKAGYQVFASTPPESLVHPWSIKYVPEAKANGFYSHRTIEDCPRLDEEQREAAIDEAGGRKATRCRREYFAEHITEETLLVIPEWPAVKKQSVVEVERPRYADCYGALDPGWSHLAGHLFGYTHFEKDWLVIEGEFAVSRKNSREISRITMAREWQLWGTPPPRDKRLTDDAWREEMDAVKLHFYPDLPVPDNDTVPWWRWNHGRRALQHQPYKRVSDTALTQIADLSAEHGLTYLPTRKDDADAAINNLRIFIQSGKLKIHPRCVQLITHLDHAIWNKQKTKFAESGEEGHFDLLAALVYLVRNLERRRNPNPPPEIELDRENVAIMYKPQNESKNAQVLKHAFMGPARRKRVAQRGRHGS